MNAVSKIEQHNPIGTDGFEFVEFTAPNAEGIEQLRTLFTQMGFTETAKHRSKEVWLFQQHDINIVLNGSRPGMCASSARSTARAPAPWPSG